MTKQDLEGIVGFSLGENAFKLDKKIYKNDIYFYERELKQDHYFYVPDKDEVFMVKHNTDNYDPDVSVTASKADSFIFNFNNMLNEGKIVSLTANSTNAFIEHVVHSTSYVDKDELITRLDNVIIELMEIKLQLKK